MQNLSYTSGMQSCSLTTLLQGGGTLTFVVTVDIGTELVPALITLSQISR